MLGIRALAAVHAAMLVLRSTLAFLCSTSLAACTERGSDGDEGSPDHVGDVCAVAEHCYPEVEGELRGAAVCLDRVEDGYCTHLCENDDDCCAVEGECATDYVQVCAPFESTGMKMCFLSCETEVVTEQDSDQFCEDTAHPRFLCRSTGGGAENRRVCVPEG